MSKIIGIDLGTTNSCVAVMEGETRKDVNPDEVVAIGAAVQAAVLSGDIEDVLLLDVTPLSLGIETLGGASTRLIERNTTIPARATELFSTAEDNQTAVTIHVLQGERERASDNKSLGQFNLENIPAGPRANAQIEVAFDIDASGILDVSATDKATGKVQSITIKASSGLGEDEVARMIRDAQQHADEDRVFHELVSERNIADALVHATRRSMQELEEAVDPETRSSVQAAIKAVESAVAGSDQQSIKDSCEKLKATSANLGVKSTSSTNSSESAGKSPADEAVADAEFESLTDND